MSGSASLSAQPWWRYPMVWMVIAGPLMVVIAGFITMALAMSSPDPVVSVTPAKDGAMAAAVQARNHAASNSIKP